MKKLAVMALALIFVACASPKSTTTQTNSAETKPAITSSPASAVNPASTATSSSAAPSSSTVDAETAKLVAEIQEINPEADAATTANLAAEIQKLHNESVYFDFDKFAVKAEFRNTIEKQAVNIKIHKSTTVLEGNADERGSAAYNMALGEKRAISVKKMLVILGIPAKAIKVVSYGKSKPKLDCHEEKCWKENRRVDFVIK